MHCTQRTGSEIQKMAKIKKLGEINDGEEKDDENAGKWLLNGMLANMIAHDDASACRMCWLKVLARGLLCVQCIITISTERVRNNERMKVATSSIHDNNNNKHCISYVPSHVSKTFSIANRNSFGGRGHKRNISRVDGPVLVAAECSMEFFL